MIAATEFRRRLVRGSDGFRGAIEADTPDNDDERALVRFVLGLQGP